MYPWPLAPFDQAHPVRAYFNDPRISGASRAFHFGIDISAPNGTPVYAVRGGVVHLEGGRSLSVVSGDVGFGYWHVIPAVSHRERVGQFQLVGHVQAPWLHVHFAERRAGVYRDPLRPGALSPWHDATRPRVGEIVLSRRGQALSPAAVSGAVDVIAEAGQLPPLPVPAPWDGLPVTPARLRWRVRRGGRTVRPWHTPVDLGRELLPQEAFRRVYAPGTRRTAPARPGSTASSSPTPGAPRSFRTGRTTSRWRPPTCVATRAGARSRSRSRTTSDRGLGIYRLTFVYTEWMAKHLIDIDEEALRAARAELGTPTIKETVNRALRRVGGEDDSRVKRSLDRLARLPLADREDAWR